MVSEAERAEPAQVEELERRLLHPDVRGDAEQVATLLHPGFREFGSSGRIWQREAILAALTGDPGAADDPLEVLDLRAQRVADDVVLVTYRADRPSRSTLRSSVWVRHDGRWRLLFHQGTVVPPTAPTGPTAPAAP